MATRIQLRRDTSANWTSINPTLAEGEIGVEKDTDKFKIGDGTTGWTSLSYAYIQADNNYIDADKTKVGYISVTQAVNLDTMESDIESKLDISGGILENYTEKLTTTTGTINLSLGSVFTQTLSSDVTYSITNAISGKAHSFTLLITQNATPKVITFPASVKWKGGTIPNMSTASKTYLMSFVTIDGGTNWLGVFGGEF